LASGDGANRRFEDVGAEEVQVEVFAGPLAHFFALFVFGVVESFDPFSIAPGATDALATNGRVTILALKSSLSIRKALEHIAGGFTRPSS
jgi:hypothetical protein